MNNLIKINVENFKKINRKNTEYCIEIVKRELENLGKSLGEQNDICKEDLEVFREVFTNDKLKELIEQKSLKDNIIIIENLRKLFLDFSYEIVKDFSGKKSNDKLKKFFGEHSINGKTSEGKTELECLRKRLLEYIIIDLEKFDFDSCKKYMSQNFNIEELSKKIKDINNEIDKIIFEGFNKEDKFSEKMKELLKKIKEKCCMINTIFKKIFNYDYYSKNYRHEIIYLLDIRTCPYCNRQYITNYEGKKTTADLDHYYAKSIYPYLSFSLYNFVPSCQICNSRFKKSVDFYKFPHLYPYEQEFGDEVCFKTKFLNGKYNIDYLLGDSKDFEIDLVILDKDSKLNLEYNNSIKTFMLKEIYQSHKDYVKELIAKVHIYNDIGINELMNIKGLFKTEDEIIAFVFGEYLNSNDLSKRPLSKLTIDILEEFGVKK